MTAAPPPNAPAGWYPDPNDGAVRRYWDGTAWGPIEPPKTEQPKPTGKPTRPPTPPEPESIGAILNETKREIKQQYEAEKEAAAGKATLIAGALVFVVFVGGTWFTDMSILGKIGMSLVWTIGIVYAMAKIAMQDDEKKKNKGQ